MPRPSLPAPLPEILADRPARTTLVVGAVVLLAAGLDPKVMSPALSTIQAAVRAQPSLEAVILVGALLTALVILVGGAVGDLTRARPIVIVGLITLLVTDVIGLLVPGGVVFSVSRFAGVAASSLLIPVGVAMVATAYRGVARAMAIGIAYAAYGGGQALMPVLLTAIPGARWPGFVVSLLVVALALWVVWPRVPELEHPGRRERPYVLGTALWAGAVVSLSTGLLWLGGGWDNPVRLGIMAVGIALLVAFAAWEWRRRIEHPQALRIDRRPVTIALFVGVVIAIAQTVPMVQLPLYFSIVARFGPLFGIVAVAPMFIALVLAGPVAGFLLARYSPRTLVGAGVVAVGLGNLAMAALAGRGAGYALFVVPLVLVGAGFVIATTVRTAIIFASVPRGLPATAAALNEASIAVGTRVGIVLVTAIVAQTALATLEPSIAALPAGGAAAREEFTGLLTAVGTPSFAALVDSANPAYGPLYIDAYVAGIRWALFLGGMAAVIGGMIAWFGLGRGEPLSARGVDPMASVYEHRDEREAAPAET